MNIDINVTATTTLTDDERTILRDIEEARADSPLANDDRTAAGVMLAAVEGDGLVTRDVASAAADAVVSAIEWGECPESEVVEYGHLADALVGIVRHLALAADGADDAEERFNRRHA